jgi:hypothetical protein
MTVESGSSVPETVPTGAGTAWRHIVALPMIVLAIAAGLALVWYSAPSILLLFAGILFASLIDASILGLGYIMPLP